MGAPGDIYKRIFIAVLFTALKIGNKQPKGPIVTQ